MKLTELEVGKVPFLSEPKSLRSFDQVSSDPQLFGGSPHSRFDFGGYPSDLIMDEAALELDSLTRILKPGSSLRGVRLFKKLLGGKKCCFALSCATCFGTGIVGGYSVQPKRPATANWEEEDDPDHFSWYGSLRWHLCPGDIVDRMGTLYEVKSVASTLGCWRVVVRKLSEKDNRYHLLGGHRCQQDF